MRENTHDAALIKDHAAVSHFLNLGYLKGIDDNGLKFQIAIKYVKDGKILDNITEIFTFSDALVKTVYSEDKAMALNVGGATDAYDSYIVELIVASDTGVTYTYTDDTLVFVPTVSTETEPEEQ